MIDKTKAGVLAELLTKTDVGDYCHFFEEDDLCAGITCDNCPFDSDQAIKETIKELEELNDM